MSSFDVDAIQACVARVNANVEWLDANDKLNNSSVSDKAWVDKPQLYKGKSITASSNLANKWNVDKSSTMANQKDFLGELRQQLAAQHD